MEAGINIKDMGIAATQWASDRWERSMIMDHRRTVEGCAYLSIG
jgi:hypothetical protein